MDTRVLTDRMRQSVRHKAPLSTEVRKVLNALMITLGSIFVLLSGVFLYHTSKSAQQGIMLENFQVTNAKLEAENRELKQKVLKSQSLETISDSPLFEEMNKVETSEFAKDEEVTLRQAP